MHALRSLPHRSIRILFALILGLQALAAAKPAFRELLFNPHWYRTYDTSSSIIPADGSLLFAWDFQDADKAVDSFFVGIDSLWGIPQDVNGDTASDWDVQVCPDEICMNGLKAGIHGANSPYPFGPSHFQAEHHVQFFPAVDTAANFTWAAPARSLFGAMMFCRSRSTGISDTVFAFGAWKLQWDTTALPPVRPVAGYLPRLSDFAISGDTVRYLKAGAGIAPGSARQAQRSGLSVDPISGGLRFSFPEIRGEKELSIFALDGRIMARSGTLNAAQREWQWRETKAGSGGSSSGFVLVRLVWKGGEAWAKAARLIP